MGARSDAFRLREDQGATDTFLVIDDHLGESIGLAQREGWTVLAYLLGMAREQLKDDLRRDGGRVPPLNGVDGADLLVPGRGCLAQAR